MRNFTQVIKKFVKDRGADLVGIAPVSRWKNAPIELSPLGIWPEAKSVVVIAVHLHDACLELSGESSFQGDAIAPAFATSTFASQKLDYISFQLARFIEKNNFRHWYGTVLLFQS